MRNMCNIPTCDIPPCFGTEFKKPLYCYKHRTEHDQPMIDVIHPRCHENDACKPSYNFPGNKMPIYCSMHAKSGMINVLRK